GTVTTITKKPLPEGVVKFSDSIGNKLCLNAAGEKILFKKPTSGETYAPVTLGGKFVSGIIIEETVPPEKDEKGKPKGKPTKNVGDAIFKKGTNTDDVNLYYGDTLLTVKLNSDKGATITNSGAEDNKYTLLRDKASVEFESAVDLNEVTETKVEQTDPFNNKTSIVEAGLELDLTPVVFSDGESAILRLSDLGYNFKASPFDDNEKFSVIDQHKITTLVTARTFDLLQLSEFEVQNTVTRRGQGIIPLFFVGEMVPFLRDIPFVGELFDRPSIQRSQLQRSVIFVNPMIFPVVNEVLDFSAKSI
ncbi:MAG: type II and III secretion system protein, partial [Firmicutes bacterium]|nr:type II and III secretion system protein [Bacillota bacterium]